MSIRVRKAQSGRLVDLSDTLCPPGTLLGLPIDAIAPGLAEPIDGDQAGQIQLESEFDSVPLAAGAHDNVPFADGTRVLDIVPTGLVTLQGVAMPPPRGNAGGFFILRKRGSAGLLSIPSNASSNILDRFFTPSASLFDLTADFDAVQVARFFGGSGSLRWQPNRKLLVPSALQPVPIGELGLRFAIRTTFAATGAAADDVTIAAALPSNMIVTNVLMVVGTAVGASTAQVRTAVGGGGVAVSSSLSTGTTGTRRNDATATVSLTLGTPLFLRRSSGNTVGTIMVFGRRLP